MGGRVWVDKDWGALNALLFDEMEGSGVPEATISEETTELTELGKEANMLGWAGLWKSR